VGRGADEPPTGKVSARRIMPRHATSRCRSALRQARPTEAVKAVSVGGLGHYVASATALTARVCRRTVPTGSTLSSTQRTSDMA